jgi:hypothetical protein
MEGHMAGFLVVAHQTAGSAELVDHLRKVAKGDPGARFTLLVPATPSGQLLVWEEGAPEEIAQRKLEAAEGVLRQAGVHITRTTVGVAAPIQAIQDELEAHPTEHDEVILCTLPEGISHWLGLDLPKEATRKLDIPVQHVTAGSAYR